MKMFGRKYQDNPRSMDRRLERIGNKIIEEEKEKLDEEYRVLVKKSGENIVKRMEEVAERDYTGITVMKVKYYFCKPFEYGRHFSWCVNTSKAEDIRPMWKILIDKIKYG